MPRRTDFDVARIVGGLIVKAIQIRWSYLVQKVEIRSWVIPLTGDVGVPLRKGGLGMRLRGEVMREVLAVLYFRLEGTQGRSR